VTHEKDPRTPDTESATSRRKSGRAPVPQSAAEWRELLAKEELPPEIGDLRGRKRRKAKRRWRSARRDERTEWIREERKKTPTPTVIPVIALIVAAAVAGAAWLWPDHHGADTAKPKATPTVQAPEAAPSASPTPTASAPTVADNPEAVAKAFVTAYTARRPVQDGSHKAAVQRAAPYASTPLVENLTKHDDRDFNQLVAAQATEAKPTKVDIGQPSAKDRPAPDTSVRVYLQADVTLDVKATDPYSYTRHLTIEVARADAASRWMVTRVLGLKE
jgi:cytoskeletal protein RodZ